jgi:hypothetical protein
MLDAIGLTRHEAKYAAGTQVDLAVRDHARCGGIPPPYVIRFGPRCPRPLRGDVDDALDHQIEFRIELSLLRGAH